MIQINKSKKITTEQLDLILDELKIKDKLYSSKIIIIKPNFAAGTYVETDSHVVSNISFLRDIINSILEINKESTIYIAESDSTGYGFAYLKFEHFNLPDCLQLDEEKAKRVKILDLSRDRLVRINNTRFKYFCTEDKQLWLSGTLMNADFIISLSNLKTHTVTEYTGACKNLFGCLPAFEKSSYHVEIHKVIHDLVLAIKPQLNIVDAFYAMEKNGPVQGSAINCGYRVFSEDAVEADICASQTAGLKPMKIKYLKYLVESIANKNYKDIQYPVIVKLKKPTLFVRVMNMIGLTIQKIGIVIERYGHRLHSCTNLLEVIIATIRPLLLKFISIDTLKKIKRKIMKK